MQTIQIPGPNKIFDGMFMGNNLAASDYDWLSMNQVTHIVNCAGVDLPFKQYEKQGINYLTFEWTETIIQTQLFGNGDSNLNSFIQFVEKARQGGGSILVHGKESQSRTCCLIIGFFMKRYGWNVLKTLQFINSRNKDAELEPPFFQQLNLLHKRLAETGIIKSFGWQLEPTDYTEMIITNTFINSQQKQEKVTTNRYKSSKTKKRVDWKDLKQRGRVEIGYKFYETDRVSGTRHQPKQIKLKSILKGFKNPQQITDKRASLQKQRPRSSTKQLQSQKEKIGHFLSSNLKGSRKIDLPSNSSTIFHNNKQNINDFFQKNQMVKARPSNFDRLKKYNRSDCKQSILNWTKTELKNIKLLDEQIKKKQGISSSSPIIIVKPNLSVSILHPQIGRSTSLKKYEQNKILGMSNGDGYLRALRTRMNESMQPQILSLKRESETGHRRQRCNSAKRAGDCRTRQNDIFSVNTLSQNQFTLKPKWR